MIYVVTAVHNRCAITEAFVRILLAQSVEEWKLILVDDGSTDGTADMVKSLVHDAVILKGDGNLWWGGALHEVYQWLRDSDQVKDDDVVMISNDDVNFDKMYIERAVSVLKTHPKTLLTGYGISLQTGEQVDGAVDLRFPEGGGHRNKSPEAYGNCASTRSLFLRVRDFKHIGGFHPILLPHYGSDYEWTYRAYKKGYQIFCTDKLSYFVNEATTGNKDRSIKMLFSKRSVSNPIYKVTFAWLTAPVGKKLISIIVQMGRIAKGILRKII